MKKYVLAILERATKTAAQSALLVLGADQLDAMHANWTDVAGFAAGGFVLSVLTSVASSGFGGDGPAAFGPETVDERGNIDIGTAVVVALLVIVLLVLLGYAR